MRRRRHVRARPWEAQGEPRRRVLRSGLVTAAAVAASLLGPAEGLSAAPAVDGTASARLGVLTNAVQSPEARVVRIHTGKACGRRTPRGEEEEEQEQEEEEGRARKGRGRGSVGSIWQREKEEACGDLWRLRGSEERGWALESTSHPGQCLQRKSWISTELAVRPCGLAGRDARWRLRDRRRKTSSDEDRRKRTAASAASVAAYFFARDGWGAVYGSDSSSSSSSSSSDEGYSADDTSTVDQYNGDDDAGSADADDDADDGRGRRAEAPMPRYLLWETFQHQPLCLSPSKPAEPQEQQREQEQREWGWGRGRWGQPSHSLRALPTWAAAYLKALDSSHSSLTYWDLSELCAPVELELPPPELHAFAGTAESQTSSFQHAAAAASSSSSSSSSEAPLGTSRSQPQPHPRLPQDESLSPASSSTYSSSASSFLWPPASGDVVVRPSYAPTPYAPFPSYGSSGGSGIGDLMESSRRRLRRLNDHMTKASLSSGGSSAPRRRHGAPSLREGNGESPSSSSSSSSGSAPSSSSSSPSSPSASEQPSWTEPRTGLSFALEFDPSDDDGNDDGSNERQQPQQLMGGGVYSKWGLQVYAVALYAETSADAFASSLAYAALSSLAAESAATSGGGGGGRSDGSSDLSTGSGGDSHGEATPPPQPAAQQQQHQQQQQQQQQQQESGRLAEEASRVLVDGEALGGDEQFFLALGTPAAYDRTVAIRLAMSLDAGFVQTAVMASWKMPRSFKWRLLASTQRLRELGIVNKQDSESGDGSSSSSSSSSSSDSGGGAESLKLPRGTELSFTWRGRTGAVEIRVNRVLVDTIRETRSVAEALQAHNRALPLPHKSYNADLGAGDVEHEGGTEESAAVRRFHGFLQPPPSMRSLELEMEHSLEYDESSPPSSSSSSSSSSVTGPFSEDVSSPGYDGMSLARAVLYVYYAEDFATLISPSAKRGFADRVSGLVPWRDELRNREASGDLVLFSAAASEAQRQRQLSSVPSSSSSSSSSYSSSYFASSMSASPSSAPRPPSAPVSFAASLSPTAALATTMKKLSTRHLLPLSSIAHFSPPTTSALSRAAVMGDDECLQIRFVGDEVGRVNRRCVREKELERQKGNNDAAVSSGEVRGGGGDVGAKESKAKGAKRRSGQKKNPENKNKKRVKKREKALRFLEFLLNVPLPLSRDRADFLEADGDNVRVEYRGGCQYACGGATRREASPPGGAGGSDYFDYFFPGGSAGWAEGGADGHYYYSLYDEELHPWSSYALRLANVFEQAGARAPHVSVRGSLVAPMAPLLRYATVPLLARVEDLARAAVAATAAAETTVTRPTTSSSGSPFVPSSLSSSSSSSSSLSLSSLSLSSLSSSSSLAVSTMTTRRTSSTSWRKFQAARQKQQEQQQERQQQQEEERFKPSSTQDLLLATCVWGLVLLVSAYGGAGLMDDGQRNGADGGHRSGSGTAAEEGLAKRGIGGARGLTKGGEKGSAASLLRAAASGMASGAHGMHEDFQQRRRVVQHLRSRYSLLFGAVGDADREQAKKEGGGSGDGSEGTAAAAAAAATAAATAAGGGVGGGGYESAGDNTRNPWPGIGGGQGGGGGGRRESRRQLAAAHVLKWWRAVKRRRISNSIF